MAKKWLSTSILIAGLIGAFGAIATPPPAPLNHVDAHKQPFLFHLPAHHYPNFYAYCEMMGNKIGFINTETDEIIQVPLAPLAENSGIDEKRWTESSCQHVWVEPDGQTLYVTIDAALMEPEAEAEAEEEETHAHAETTNESNGNEENNHKTKKIPATLLVLKLKELDWGNDNEETPYVDLKLVKVLLLEEEPTKSALIPPEAYGEYPVTDWFPKYTQGHGPSFLPHSHFTYLTEWTSPRIRVLDTRTHEWVEGVDPVPGRKGVYPHGINFNSSGTLGLATGYFYDLDDIDIYKPNKQTGELTRLGSIRLVEKETGNHAAFTHYTFWLNNRYALTVTMQVWPTADTPDPEKLIGPSVWLLDVYRKTAEKIVDPVTDRDPEMAKGEAGVFRPGSDLVVANGKLYVAEEDSLEGRLPADEEADGYVSIFDISDARYPHFIKRLVPHEDFDVGTDYLPADFAIAHGLGVTPDNRYVYVASYASGYILKIDTAIDQVVAVFNAEKGVEMPHGGFIPGNASDSSFAHPPQRVEPRRFGFKK